MSTNEYLVLRISGADDSPYRGFLEGNSGAGGPAAVPVEYRVEAEAMDPQDYREARRDRSVAAIARPMPLKLIEPVAMGEPAADPEPVQGTTWGVFVTGAPSSPYTGHGITVAVLDTGIDKDHEAFQGITLVQKDFTGEGNGDQNGHGTHVAGTIFGQAGQGMRYAVAPGVRRALIAKVLGTQRMATTKELVDAIQWAVDGGAHIINMSLGFDFPGLVRYWTQEGLEVDLATSRALAQYRDNVRLFDSLVNLLRARGAQYPSALIVAAAGNESRRDIRADYTIEVAPPAAADGLVSVAALQTAGPPHKALVIAPFSNARAAISAPGMGILSAKRGGGYTQMHGTSQASPHVAGVAALWAERQLQRTGTVNVATLEAQVTGNARFDRLGDASYLDVGAGLVAAPTD